MSNKHQYEFAIIIGRFQPLHKGHVYLIKSALLHAKKILILLGSSYRARSVRNPFLFTERKNIIIQEINKNIFKYKNKIIIDFIEDIMYSNKIWINMVINKVKKYVKIDKNIILVGYKKDKTSKYLSFFKRWYFCSIKNYQSINASGIRKCYFIYKMIQEKYLPESSIDFLKKFFFTNNYKKLRKEALFIQNYKNKWIFSPYPIIFFTIDTLLTINNNLLLIKRKTYPGKNLWALPGGFLKENEPIHIGLLRELKEETSINLDNKTLLKNIQKKHIFDHPKRSQLGRIISFAFWINLKNKNLPYIHENSDAKKVLWIPLKKIYLFKNKMHDDHYYIIQKFNIFKFLN